MEPSQVDMVLLAGQGLKIFTVVDLVERIFPKTPKEKRFQEAAVVRGLCQYTGVLTGRVAELLLLDANYTSIGIKAISCDHEQGQAVNDAGECDFWLSSNSSKNNDTLQILPVSTTIPTIKTLRGRAIGGRDPELVVVEGSTLDDQSETVIVKHIFSGLQEGDECEIQVEADADRTLVLWTANPRTKEIHGYQLNNPFKELLGGTTKPTQYIQRRFTAGMAAEGFRILPVIKVGTTATRT
jgi:hypothetical protein